MTGLTGMQSLVHLAPCRISQRAESTSGIMTFVARQRKFQLEWAVRIACYSCYWR